jgi:membrane protease YdiL (CAAX protease family)
MQFPALINENWKKDGVIGLLVGIGFVLINLLSPAISIGLPSLGLAVGESARGVVVGVLAPVIEESLFRGAILFLLIGLGVFVIPAILISAATFALYHFTAYGSSIFTSSGALVGALLFAVIASVLVLWRKSLLPAIVCHAVFNMWLVTKLTVVFG